MFVLTGPVQFERDEEDPFGLDQFLDTAKRASGSNKRSNEEDRKTGGDRDRKDNKRSRKDYWKKTTSVFVSIYKLFFSLYYIVENKEEILNTYIFCVFLSVERNVHKLKKVRVKCATKFHWNRRMKNRTLFFFVINTLLVGCFFKINKVEQKMSSLIYTEC